MQSLTCKSSRSEYMPVLCYTSGATFVYSMSPSADEAPLTHIT